MAERTDPATELRELCTSLAIQAGARKAVEIVDLAEALRAYIQLGPDAGQKRAGNAAVDTTKLPNAGGLRSDQLNAENDG